MFKNYKESNHPINHLKTIGYKNKSKCINTI